MAIGEGHAVVLWTSTEAINHNVHNVVKIACTDQGEHESAASGRAWASDNTKTICPLGQSTFR
jgi:hypothetical protein